MRGLEQLLLIGQYLLIATNVTRNQHLSPPSRCKGILVWTQFG